MIHECNVEFMSRYLVSAHGVEESQLFSVLSQGIHAETVNID